jgi:hypothetical protein
VILRAFPYLLYSKYGEQHASFYNPHGRRLCSFLARGCGHPEPTSKMEFSCWRLGLLGPGPVDPNHPLSNNLAPLDKWIYLK